MSDPILGIDFGTTNTSAAYFDAQGRLRIVPVTDKSNVLPSVVWFHAPDKALVGHGARTQIVDDPRHTVFESKRFLGRRYNSEFVARIRDRFAYDVIEGPDGYCAVSMYERTLSMTEVAQMALKHVLTLANHAAGAPFKECVITVPVHANVRQREAMRLAAARAGLTVRALINEPTAAALYYANLRNPQQTVLVFDLGGGTFDATLMAVENRRVRVLATGGDAFLGGANFDAVIAEHLVQAFQDKHGLDLRTNKVVMQRLAFAAEVAKINLSRVEEFPLRIPCVAQKGGQFVDLEQTLTRKGVEDLVVPLIERAVGACDDVLARAGIAVDKVDELVLVGGQTRMPAIRERFNHYPRFSSEKDVHPELGVCIGAAILGRNLSRGGTGLADVNPMPISVMLPGGGTHEVIPANTPVPATRSVALESLPPWQAPVPVAIFESVDATSVEREVFGTVAIPVEWRVGKGGAPSLELELAQDFTVKARLVAANGESAPLAINEVRPAA